MRRIGLSVVLLLLCACGSPTSPSSRCPVGPYVPLLDITWPCPPASAIREIDAEVTLLFLEDPTAGTLVCRAADGSVDLTRLQERAYQTLYLLKRLEFDAPLPWTDKSLWGWFTSNIRRIQYRGTGNPNCCGGNTMNMPAHDASRYRTGFPTGVFGYIHEARHAEKPHTCDAGSKDRTIAEMGAFGVQYYFGLWVADHLVAPALTVEERNYARQASAFLRTRAFCTECGGL